MHLVQHHQLHRQPLCINAKDHLPAEQQVSLAPRKFLFPEDTDANKYFQAVASGQKALGCGQLLRHLTECSLVAY
jgi:hypothetical protein